MSDAVERVAEHIHNAMRFERLDKPAWQNGNSDAEEVARLTARAAIDALIDGVELEWVEFGDGQAGWVAYAMHRGYSALCDAEKSAALTDYRNRLRAALGVNQ